MATFRKQPLLRGLAAALVLLSSGAWAQTRTAVLTFTGPQGPQVRGQVVKGVCAETTCVPQAKLLARNRPDWAAIRREGVEVVLTGKVAGPAAKRAVTVEAHGPTGRRLWREKIALARNGTIPKSALDKLASRVAASGGKAGPSKTPPREVDRTEPEERPRQTEGGRTRFSDQSGGTSAAATTAAAPADAEVRTDPPGAPRAPGAPPLVVGEAGLAFIHRTLVYADLGAPNLRSYETRPMLFAPRFRVEGYPLSLVTEGPVTQLGVELDFLFAVFLRSVDENAVAYPTRFSRFDVGLRMNFRPVEEVDLVVAPVAGFRGGGFRVGESDDGLRLAGLPGIAYDAVRAGAAAEYGLDELRILFRLEYVHGLNLGEIGSDAFFPDSRARSVDVQGGVGYRITDQLEARILLGYTRYGLSFTPVDGATYRASGAADQQLGMSATARFEY